MFENKSKIYQNLLTLFAGLALLLIAACEAPPQPLETKPVLGSVRQTLLGEVIGVEAEADTYAWLGIPFAEPPVGALRWRAATPQKPWQAQFQATSVGAHCVQVGTSVGLVPKESYGQITGSEDCLYLNIWTPRFAPDEVPKGDEKLPVMVWIHGGGNIYGHGGPWTGSILAAKHKLVIVTINYRLGPLGWFHHPQLNSADNPRDWSGNYGNLDTITALQWVQQHIDAFGGNPDKVTVFGESAGGRNVAALLVSPLAKGLFKGAIIQSGVAGLASLSKGSDYSGSENGKSSRNIVLNMLMHDGQANSSEQAVEIAESMTAKELSDFLRQKSATEIFKAYSKDSNIQGISLDFPQVFADGYVLPVAGILKSLSKRGHYNMVPVMLGSNKDELKLFMAMDDNLVWRPFNIPVYIKDEKKYNLFNKYGTAAWKAFGVDELALALSKNQPDSVFAYRWDWDEQGTALFMDMSMLLGAAHALEIPFIFGDFSIYSSGATIYNEDNRDGRLQLSEAMMSYWANFAYTGAPRQGRSKDFPHWGEFNPLDGQDRLLVLDTEKGGGIRMSKDVVSVQSIIEDISNDKSLLTQEDICAVFDVAFHWFERQDVKTAREKIGNGGCVQNSSK